jgi:hypothetical protein
MKTPSVETLALALDVLQEAHAQSNAAFDSTSRRYLPVAGDVAASRRAADRRAARAAECHARALQVAAVAPDAAAHVAALQVAHTARLAAIDALVAAIDATVPAATPRAAVHGAADAAYVPVSEATIRYERAVRAMYVAFETAARG